MPRDTFIGSGTLPLTLFLPLLLAFSLLAPAAFAGDFRIIPGQRIGTVTLGMSRASAHTLLHAPNTTHRAHGMILDTWLSHAPLPKSAAEQGNYLKRDYLTVFFRRGHAVQIEVSAAKFKTASGLSTQSSARAFDKQYPSYQTLPIAGQSGSYVDYHVTGDPAYSSPAPKHFVDYGDAVHLGIAWKYGGWAAGWPDIDPSNIEAVIVHEPGQAVLLNPNDGLPYSGTGPARK